uniref:Uncharacterized protein n=1 Tax=Ananas comosus var. bracteatus TaxID=296719 RepID=A0A6V7Q2B0_ANACO|nr:unnamed protein product [Ananas comosus var. bracteatus]
MGVLGRLDSVAGEGGFVYTRWEYYVDRGQSHDLREEPGPHGGRGSDEQEALLLWRIKVDTKVGMEIGSFKSKRNGIRVSCSRFDATIMNAKATPSTSIAKCVSS